jgi:YteA family regulatory protein
MMDKRLVGHKRQLEALKKDLLEQVEFSEGLQKHESLRDATQELSMVDNHPADLGSENYERAKDISLHERNLLTLHKVEEALEKMEKGKYGRCVHCGQPIGDERLDALPYTEYCVECKRAAEKVPRDDARPLEEHTLGTPFARSYMGDKDYTGYDGEDAWQDVAVFNKLPHVFYEETADESDETLGAVEDTDRISNEEYRDQLPD